MATKKFSSYSKSKTPMGKLRPVALTEEMLRLSLSITESRGAATSAMISQIWNDARRPYMGMTVAGRFLQTLVEQGMMYRFIHPSYPKSPVYARTPNMTRMQEAKGRVPVLPFLFEMTPGQTWASAELKIVADPVKANIFQRNITLMHRLGVITKMGHAQWRLNETMAYQPVPYPHQRFAPKKPG